MNKIKRDNPQFTVARMTSKNVPNSIYAEVTIRGRKQKIFSNLITSSISDKRVNKVLMVKDDTDRVYTNFVLKTRMKPYTVII